MPFFTRISKLFQRGPETSSSREAPASSSSTANAPVSESRVPIERSSLVYPPVDPGMPVPALVHLLDAQSDLITRIKTHSAMEGDRFEIRFGGPISRLANYIGPIPATSNGLFAGPGGLLKACVEMGLYAFQASHGRIFTGHLGVEQRFLLEVRWQYVCFAAGLVWPIGKTLDQIQVASDEGMTWAARVKPMLDWAEQTHSKHLHINWPDSDVVPGPSATAAALVSYILGEQNLQWMEEGSPSITTALMGIASGQRSATYGIAFDLINDMWRRICQAEEARNPKTYGRAMYGQHLGPHILDCIAVLIGNGEWKENEGPLIVNETGVYLIWPDAGTDIIKTATEVGKNGFPNTAAGLLSSIENAKLITVDPNIGPLMDIADANGEIKSSVKISKPMSVIVDYDPGNYTKQKVMNLEETEKKIDAPAMANTKLPEASNLPVQPNMQASALDKREETPSPPQAGSDPFAGIHDIGADAMETVKLEVVEQASTAGIESGSMAEAVDPDEQVQPENVDIQKPVVANPDLESKSSKPVIEKFENQRGENIRALEEKPVEEEVKEIKYSDLLPKDLRASLNNMTAETLGKLVMVWRENGPNDQMRTVEKGIAFSVITLKGLVHDVPSFIENMAQQGYIDINPLTPGRKIQDVAIPEGSKKKVSCFVISRGLVQKLGL